MQKTSGCVYAAYNTYLPYMLKIGMTSRCPEMRAVELSKAAGVPGNYHIAFVAEFDSGYKKAEKMFHKHFEMQCVETEFFILTLAEFLAGVSAMEFRSLDDDSSPVLTSASLTGMGEELLINQITEASSRSFKSWSDN